jgi:S-DNA-T family DNA segregation ATPase FtsK/SpoIIIE
VLLAASLDARSEIWCWEFKGTGDFSAISRVATRYGSGADDATMRSALDGLRALRKECDRRAAVIREMDREQCPEFKVTSAVANTPSLHLLIMALDEVQELMTHKQYKQGLAEQIISSAARLGSS